MSRRCDREGVAWPRGMEIPDDALAVRWREVQWRRHYGHPTLALPWHADVMVNIRERVVLP